MKYRFTFEVETYKLPAKWFQPILDEVLTSKERITNASWKLIKEEDDGGSQG